MPTLAQSLHSHDLGHLRIIAEHWGIELTAPDTRTALPMINATLLNSALISEIIEILPPESQNAIHALAENHGKLPWSQFARRFGDVRAMGPGRRDRERPDRESASPAETLWYRALIARAFFDTSSGAQEFAYIPDDLLPLIPVRSKMETQTGFVEEQPKLGRAATPEERAYPLLVEDRLLDHICTLLASSRLELDPISQFPPASSSLLSFAASLLKTANLLDPNGSPDQEMARTHLEISRGEALSQLTQAWLRSEEHNDLHHMPYLESEGEWRNDPLKTRQFFMGLLAAIRPHTWWSISAFLADLRRDFPDFQRPAGDYDFLVYP